jgi:hypothetical protein
MQLYFRHLLTYIRIRGTTAATTEVIFVFTPEGRSDTDYVIWGDQAKKESAESLLFAREAANERSAFVAGDTEQVQSIINES